MLEGWVDAVVSVTGGDLYAVAFVAGGICALLTFLGSLPALAGAKLGSRTLDVGLGFSAGIMLVASFTSLILPGIEVGGVWSVLVGISAGSLTVHVINKCIPHEHLVKGFEGPESLRSKVKAIWLMVFAIIIHNFPEGLAVGTGVAYSVRDGLMLALAIGIQDVPEGLAVSMPLVGIGMGKAKALFVALLSGLSELLMAMIPVAIASTSTHILPFLMGFAGGSMI
ncbi:MAG: ZIP family metal transporter [Desulfurococcales archaeon]|nr:ZIP family metal transporter [Desulfurococcales archaeon]